MRTMRVRYDEHGRSVQRPWLRVVLIVVAIAILLWIVGYLLFSVGGTVPGTGEGDVVQTP